MADFYSFAYLHIYTSPHPPLDVKVFITQKILTNYIE